MPSCFFVQGSHHESINEISWDGVGVINITGVSHVVSLRWVYIGVIIVWFMGKKLKWGQGIYMKSGFHKFFVFSLIQLPCESRNLNKNMFFFSQVLVLTCVFSIVMIDSAFFCCPPLAHSSLAKDCKEKHLGLWQKKGGCWSFESTSFF